MLKWETEILTNEDNDGRKEVGIPYVERVNITNNINDML